MIVHKFHHNAQLHQPFYRFLMSDLHLGSMHADHAHIVRDLDAARAAKARILINGDVFDAICPTDKRYDAAVLHSSLFGKKDLTRAIVEMGFEILRPYADLIDVIGIGNHEEAWIRYNHSDPVRMLIDLLNANKKGGDIRHGSFGGWIRTTFSLPGSRARILHKLYYYHGTGGDSPVTKGTIDFNRKGRNFAYDCLTFGHKHNMAITAEAIADLTPRGSVVQRQQLNLQTASYYQNYIEETEDNPLTYSYAESKAHTPKPMGGVFLVMRPWQSPDGSHFVHQDFMSDFIPPWKTPKEAKPVKVAA